MVYYLFQIMIQGVYACNKSLCRKSMNNNN